MDYEPIEAFLMGECGMTAQQAGFTTLREFNVKVNARQKAEEAKWERARWQMFLMLQMMPLIKPHSKPKSAQAWIRFPWEKAQNENQWTAEDCKVTDREKEQLTRIFQQFKNKKKN